MKRIALTFIFLIFSFPSHAIFYVDEAINSSSFTLTSDTTKQIPNTRPNDSLVCVIVSTKTAGGTLTLFDGQGSNATTKIGVVDLNSTGFYPFGVSVSSGITYTTSGNAQGVTIIYRLRIAQ